MKVTGTTELRAGSDHEITLNFVQTSPYGVVKAQLKSFAEDVSESAATMLNSNGILVSTIRIKAVAEMVPTMNGTITVYKFTATVEGEPYEEKISEG